MRVLSIAVCLSVAASLAACEEEPATVLPRDAGADAGGTVARDGGGTSPTGVTGGLDAGKPATLPVESDGDWVVFPQDGGAPNAAENIKGVASATAIDGGTKFVLEVAELPPGQKFGTHLHTLPCDAQQGGPHYQNVQAPQGQANDPKFANEKNEVWLDFEADVDGEGRSEVDVTWVPRKGGAGSVVVHERSTGDGGVAGSRLACTNLAFED